MANLEESIRSSMWQEVFSKIESAELQKCCTAGNVVRYRDRVGDRKDGEKEVTELKMVRSALGVMLKDRVRNKNIWGRQRSEELGRS